MGNAKEITMKNKKELFSEKLKEFIEEDMLGYSYDNYFYPNQNTIDFYTHAFEMAESIFNTKEMNKESVAKKIEDILEKYSGDIVHAIAEDDVYPEEWESKCLKEIMEVFEEMKENEKEEESKKELFEKLEEIIGSYVGDILNYREDHGFGNYPEEWDRNCLKEIMEIVDKKDEKE